MADRFVTVATFGTPVEAELAKNRLDAEGIRAYIADDATVGWFWYLGNAVSGVKLQVAEADEARATEVLEALHADRGETFATAAETPVEELEACAHCGATLAAEVAACPSCGAISDRPADAELRSSVSDLPVKETAERADDEEPAVGPGDELATRACRAAVLGLLLCPPLLHVYSAWLLVRLGFFAGELSPAGTRKMYVALLIDGVIFLMAFLFLREVWSG